MSELIVYDDVPSLIGETPTSHAVAMSGPPALASNAASATMASAHSATSDMLLISRRTLYFQGVLFVIVAASAFSAGFFIGRGPAPMGTNAPNAAGNNEPVVLQGTVIFARSTGDMLPDDGAVIAALPEGAVLDEPIAATGLRPQDPHNPDADGIQAIIRLGGDMVRADATGKFQLVVRKPGPYHLLIISNQSKRPRGRTLDAAQLKEMTHYFAAPADLIGANQYHWSLQHLAGTPRPLLHQFKLDK
jgi:hypothetical protein